jgi:hypothetical protein
VGDAVVINGKWTLAQGLPDLGDSHVGLGYLTLGASIGGVARGELFAAAQAGFGHGKGRGRTPQTQEGLGTARAVHFEQGAAANVVFIGADDALENLA